MRVHAEGDQEARALLEKAKTAFALSHYAQAADYFEKAFELKADPALLYNAAQSHRLAGNKERALVLFQNYLRVFSRDQRHDQIEARIDELKRAIDRDRKAGAVAPPPPQSGDATSPNGSAAAAPAPASAAPQAAAPPAAVPSAAPPPPALASTSASNQPTGSPLLVASPPAEDTSLTHKPWFWAVVGGGVAVAVVVVLVVALSGTKDPSASLGSANGN